jgi:predicted ArsR family transcriptional regulator
MKGTRAEIVALLQDRGEATVTDLADTVGIAPAALRRHLEILEGEGLVEHRSVKQPTGRPYFAYRLTERAREAGRTNYPRLLERIVTGMAALPPEETSQKSGSELLATVFENMSDELAADYRDQVRGRTLEERVGQVTRALRGEGIVERWEKRDGTFVLTTSCCPHRRAAAASHELCSSETRAIAKLLGADVEQVQRVVDGASCCEYLVRPGDAPGARQEAVTADMC